MTNVTGPDMRNQGLPVAGWYPDPSGLPRQRWWDGTQWTEHLHDPSLETYGVAPAVVVGPDTPAYTPYIWAIVLLPILSLIALVTMDPMGQAFRIDEFGVPQTSVAMVVIELLGWATYAAIVILAYLDYARLKNAGFARPFHWAWAFLSSGVYVIGRSVVVHRSIRRSLTPIWVYAAVALTGLIIVTVQLVAAVSTFMSTVPGGIVA